VGKARAPIIFRRSAGAAGVRAAEAISTTIRDFKRDYWTGTIYTTNRRVWEHDEVFKKYLRKIRAMAWTWRRQRSSLTGFYNEISPGPCCLVSDQPMVPRREDAESDRKVDENYVNDH